MYTHKVQYYETDKMGITHHSNYIRFMEEARVDWLDKIGWSFRKCEDMGMLSPVLSVKCDYKKNTTFDDIIEIDVKITKYNGVKMTLEYVLTKEGELIAKGETSHCFINKNGLPIRIKKFCPEMDDILNKQLNESI